MDDLLNVLVESGIKKMDLILQEHARMGDRGHSIYKITFRVAKSDNEVDDKLDFSVLLPDIENRKEKCF